MPITQAKIFPPIGIARVGNSPDDFFIGPEIPGDRTSPSGGYKDSECRIKRQAARFRIFGYDGDTLVGEITDEDAAIEWTVHMVHKKSAHLESDPSRTIDPGDRTLTGPNQQAKFDTGTFTYPGESPINVPLGEIRTDTQGRLLVLGGFGANGSPVTSNISSLYDARWYDDIGDGPVTASVVLNGGGGIPVMGAWIIVAPPNFAPPIDNPTSLYDRLYDFQGLPEPSTPSFTNDIYPILRSAININAVRNIGSAHTSWNLGNLSDTSTSAQPLRQAIFDRLENPSPPPAGSNMPELAGDSSLRQIQYNIMEKWKDGNFITDWPGSPPVPDPNGPITPDGLTKAALENCVGASFSPGIEAGSELISDPGIYIEPFRLDHSIKSAGDITKVMSVPWQSDFSACTGSWWPAQRPGQVITQGTSSYEDWRSGVSGAEGMADFWHTLGFVVEEGNDFVMVGRCDSASINLLTPSINFIDTPQGPGGLTRTVAKAITFEVISPGDTVNFEIVNYPTHPRINLIDPGPFSIGPTTPGSLDRLYIKVKYETGTVGESINNSVTIHNSATSQEWTVDINASTLEAKKSAVALVLDRSGSMSEDRGDGSGSKTDNLIIAAKNFVDLMLTGDGAGVVRYNHNAQKLEDITELGPITDPFDPGRSAVKDRFSLAHLNPSGTTSIGDGIEKGRIILDDSSGYDIEALVILSDGKENSPKFIEEVVDSINNRTYAIGFGTPENTNIAALQNLSGNNGGYLLVTGEISSDNQFLLQKYFLQILAGITNAEIVSDPQGELYPGNEHRIPFKLTESDNGIDVILLSDAPQLINFYIRTPDSRIIDPQKSESLTSVDYILSEGISYYRIGLPVEVEEDRPEQAGTWHAILQFGDQEEVPFVRKKYSHLYEDRDLKRKSISYNVLVHSYSDLQFRGISVQQGFELGVPVTLNASVSQYGFPIKEQVNFRTEVTAPDGSTEIMPLKADDNGKYTLDYDTSLNGVYKFRLLAEGKSQMGWPFQREQTFTVPVWQGGDASYKAGDPANEDRARGKRCNIFGWVFILLFALTIISGVLATTTVLVKIGLSVGTLVALTGWFFGCRPPKCKITETILIALIIAIVGIGGVLIFGLSVSNILPTVGLLGTGIIAAGVFGYLQECACCR